MAEILDNILSDNEYINSKRDRILSQDYAEFIYPERLPRQSVLDRYKAEFFQPISNTHSTFFVPTSKTEDFNFSNYGYNIIPKVYGLMDTSPLEASGIIRLANQPVLALKGQGVIIGIVDTGIDYTLPAFRDSTGRTRILRIWDQSQNSGKLPESKTLSVNGYSFALSLDYGSEYTEADINEALKLENPYELVNSRDTVGHGTFLAGVAGGTPDIANNFSGAATEAKFIIVKLKEAKDYLRRYYYIPDGVPAYQDNDIIAAINYIRTYSSIFQMPVSLLVALGTNQGGHDGRSLLARELNNYRNNIGTCVTVAAGNEGNARHHFSGRAAAEDEPVEVEVEVEDKVDGFTMEVWVDAPQVVSVGIISPTGETVAPIASRLGNSQIIDFIFEKTRAYVDYEIIENSTGDEMVYLRFREPTVGVWRIQIYAGNINTGNFNCWLPITPFVNGSVYFLKPDPYITIVEPGMSNDVITVTAYDSRNGAFYLNSGRGFSRINQIVPDISAPGVGITGPTLTGGYENRDGTSLAAAITAGACAQIMTWGIVEGNRNWMSSAEVKSFLIRGAIRDADIIYPDRQWGYGKLDVYNSFETLRRS